MKFGLHKRIKVFIKCIGLFCSIIICFYSPGQLFAQTDTEFWFGAPEISYEYINPSPFIFQGLDRPIRIYLTTADGPADFIIDQPANPSFLPITGVVKMDSTKEIDLTAFIDIIENKPSDSILNYGLRIRSDKPITCYYEVQSLYNQDTFVLKGKNALGYEFIVPAQSHFNNYANCAPAARNSFVIVASEDSTTVTVIPTSYIDGHGKYDTIIVQLNKGQTWCARATSGDSTQHLGGSFVFADKPVAVTVADDELEFPSSLNYSKDLAGDQLIPRNLCGKAFIANMISLPAPIGARALLYAFEDSTLVNINGGPSYLIDRGQVHEFEIFGPDAVSYVTSTKPVLAYHFRGSKIYNWNFSGCIIPPLTDCSGSRRISMCRTPPILPNAGFALNFVTKNGNQGNFTVVGNPPFILPPTGWGAVPGTNGDWVFYDVGWGNFGAQSYVISNSSGRFQVSSSTEVDEYFDKGNYYTDVSSLNLGTDRKICPGESLMIDAGYGWTNYLWNTGATTQSIQVGNPGTYWVQTSDIGCFMSDTIVISHYWTQSVNIGPDRQICLGDSILLNAGSGRIWYLWNTGDSTQTIWVKDPGNYWVKAQDVHCVVSDTVQVTTIPTPIITNSLLSKGICTGESTDIYLTSNDPLASFHWTVDLLTGIVSGFSADSGLQINQTLVNTGATAGLVVYHIAPSAGDCIGDPVDFFVTVNVGDPVDVIINASGNAVCAGTMVSFAANPINPGNNPVYQWKVNGVNAGFNTPNFNYVPANGDTVTCMLTSSNVICTSNNPATSNSIIMVVNTIQPVSVTVSTSSNPVCVGTQVNFTAIPVNGGVTPQYQWTVNGLIAGTNSPAYSYFPLNGDEITCSLTSNVLCPSGNPAISNTVTMSVNPILPIGVSIIASTNPFCSGSPVTFTATPMNGGVSPNYQWKVNGINAGSNNTLFTYNPLNGDVVTCWLTSSESCTSGNPAQSNPITMVVNANMPAGITIVASSNPFCPGTTVTYTATPGNGGPSPIYQWIVNGTNAGTNSPVFAYGPANNDSIRCVLTSNLSCVTSNPASSGKIIMIASPAPNVTFTTCFDTVTTISAKPFKLKGGIPLGGTFSGPGVNSLTGTFTPSLAGTGFKTIQYTYSNVASCSAGKSKTILVQANPAFTCGNSFTDIRDGKSYPTVLIGTQCWMSANLNYGSNLNSSQVQNDNCLSEKYCYNDVTGNCTKYGGLYQWDEVMKYDDTPAGQGLCPPGWHVPTEAEWTTLFNFYLGNGLAGKPLQDTIMAGFHAQTSGVFYLNSSWSFNGFATLFWTSTPWNAVKAISHGMNVYDFSVSLYPSSRANAFPVRCLRD